jgi:WD40 repeat protein
MEVELTPEDEPLVLPPQYWAFISYSHQDEEWASWLHKAIETYSEHKKLVGMRNRYGEPVPARLFPVFRDRRELEGALDLPEHLHDALRLSRFLIVICSPHAAKSKRVNEEIKLFKALGRQGRILAMIVDGKPNAATDEQECFPRALKFRLGDDGAFTDKRAEPVAADVRKQGERGALLKLLAAMLGVRFDDLGQRDLERQRRHWMRLGIATAAGFLVLLGLTILAFKERNEALRERDAAELRAREVLSRNLAQSAEAVMAKQLDRGLLLAAHAAQLAPTFEARRALRLALGKMPRLERFLASSGAAVSAIAVDRAGKYAAVGRSDGDIAVFELETGAPVPDASVRQPHPVLRLAFTDAGPASVVAVAGDTALRSLRGGSRVQTFDLRLGRESLRDAAFNPNGKTLATLDESQRLVIWDVEKWPPTKQRTLDLPEDVRPPLRVLAGSNTVALFTRDESVVTADADTGQITKRALKVPGPEPLAVSADGQEVAARSREGSNQTFTVQHLETGQRSFSSSWDELFFVTFSADASQIATSHADGVVRIRDRSGEAHNVRLPATYVWAGAFDSGGRRLITGGDSGAVAVWRVGVGSPARTTDYTPDHICRPNMGPRSVTLSQTGDRLVVACEEGVVNLADLSRADEAPRSFRMPGAAGVKELLSLEKYRVLALLDDGRLAVLDVRDPSKTESRISFIKGLRSVTALSRNGQTVGAMTRNGEVLTWKSSQAVDSPARLRLPPGDWGAFAIGPEGAEVVVGSPQGLLMHIDVRANRSTPVASGGAKFVSLSISPDGKSLAAVDERARAMVRSLDTAGGNLRAIEGVGAAWTDDKRPLVSAEAGILARFVQYAPDGRYLALATDAGVLLLDPLTLRRLSEPLSHSAATRLAFSFDGIGSRMARVFRSNVQATDLGIEIDDLDWTSWIRAACRKANRELSESEIQIYLGGLRPLATCAQGLRGANGGL